MVSYDDRAVPCTICNPSPNATKKKITLMVRSTYTVSKLFSDIKTQMDVDNFEVQLTKSSGPLTMRESDNRTLHEVGIDFNAQQRLMLTLVSLVSTDQVDNLTKVNTSVEPKEQKSPRKIVVKTVKKLIPKPATDSDASAPVVTKEKTLKKLVPTLKGDTASASVTTKEKSPKKLVPATESDNGSVAVPKILKTTKKLVSKTEAASKKTADSTAQKLVSEPEPKAVSVQTSEQTLPTTLDAELVFAPTAEKTSPEPTIPTLSIIDAELSVAQTIEKSPPKSVPEIELEAESVSPPTTERSPPKSVPEIELEAGSASASRKEETPTKLVPDIELEAESALAPIVEKTPQRSVPDLELYGESVPTTTTQRRQAIFEKPSSSDDLDLTLGASASPVEPEASVSVLPLFSDEPTTSAINIQQSYPSSSRTSSGYCGLVNQAMTCYLNSLLQALFMTPEFRNALYNWEFDGSDPNKNIPYQLQRLFVNMQTSPKPSVETTDLTKSFGWDSTEAWHQHDIQELCRVMFDALEKKFKGTKQEDLINRLYEGKMIDYVKCLDCNTEKSREALFQDLPLPLRNFGSTVAYSSVEEALRAFVQPETLDGSNQYFCEKCNKKCDAHKGLKFSKFPYVLTLHLKRFDFDYQTFHRIKLNDKVTFPEKLNLNSFVKEPMTNGFAQTPNGTANCSDATNSEHGSVESAIKCDDCSTTDSGSVLEDEIGNGTSSTVTKNGYGDGPDDDEGIDMSTSTEAKSLDNEPGPYEYELFSIMIHSGSASGGHYYAYIKEFENGQWYCFNDQSVTTITGEDIEKSFGGGYSARPYYSSAYSSSTNAYMLMYRQIDPQRNTSMIKNDSFPEHIKHLVTTLKEDSERRTLSLRTDHDIQRYKVYYFDPKIQRLSDVRVHMASDATLEETLSNVYNRFKLRGVVPLERCRLVAFDYSDENIHCSFEGKDKELIRDLMGDLPIISELLLEVRDENVEFEPVSPGSIETKVYTVAMNSADIDGPIQIRVQKDMSVGAYKKLLASKLGWNANEIVMAVLKFSSHASLMEIDIASLHQEDVGHKSKLFVANVAPSEHISSKFTKIVDRFHLIISLYFVLPKTDKETLEKMSIPSYVPPTEKSVDSATTNTVTNHCLTNGHVSNGPTTKTIESSDVVDAVMNSPPLIQYVPSMSINHSTQSVEPDTISEDSSLSDSDRTLVGDVSPIESLAGSSAYFDQQWSSPEEPKVNGAFGPENDCDMVDDTKSRDSYFKAVYYEEPISGESNEPTRMLKVLVHKNLIVGNLKRALEPHIKVPMEYFKIFRHTSSLETECSRLNEKISMFNDGERLSIELGRALRPGEYKCKLYHMKLSDMVDDHEKITSLCEWILCRGATVEKTKRDILAHITKIDAKLDMAFDCARLRRKVGKTPGQVYLDNEVFGEDIIITSISEIIVQELDSSAEQLTDSSDLSVFVRQWNPATLVLDHFKEIVIRPKDELKQVLSEISGIAAENIEFAKVNGNFPNHNISTLDIQMSLAWNNNECTLEEFPLTTTKPGNIIFYRNKTEKLKELTADERRELKNKEISRMDPIIGGSRSTYSPRRERALKIYVDSPPKKQDN